MVQRCIVNRHASRHRTIRFHFHVTAVVDQRNVNELVFYLSIARSNSRNARRRNSLEEEINSSPGKTSSSARGIQRRSVAHGFSINWDNLALVLVRKLSIYHLDVL